MAFFDRFKKQGKTEEVMPEGSGKPDDSAAPQSNLIDFHPCDTDLASQVQSLIQEYQNRIPAQKPCGHDAFIALLAGIAALRKTPGIPGPDQISFTTLPQCATSEDKAACREHLEHIFGITDKDSLLGFCKQEIICSHQYSDFVGFWEGNPPFDMKKLNPQGLEFFTKARDFSAQFYPIVGHQGYLAWDISECMGHLRSGYACGLLSRDEFDELTKHWLEQAKRFDNWVDFAASLLCGELYWDFQHGADPSQLNKGLDLYRKLVTILLDSSDAWGSGMWYTQCLF